MPIFNRIIVLSKQIAVSLIKNEKPTEIETIEIFNKNDREYILNNLTQEKLIRERSKLKQQIDTQKGWNSLKNKIEIPVRKIYWKYSAVAASIVIAIIAFGNLFIENNNINSVKSHATVKNKIIKGKNKALLTLENGKEMPLEKGTSFETKNMKTNGEKLVYNKVKNQNLKIAYNYLTIPRGGQFYIQLSDGTEVWLNSESKLKYPVSFISGQTRQVELIYGEAYFKVSPSTLHNGAKFKVQHKTQEIKVLGTAFNIKAYKDETNIYTTLIEGKVAVNILDNNRILAPNEQLKLNLLNDKIEISIVDVYNEISWKEGVFSFENKPLKQIMKVLSRWYDMEVSFSNKDIEEEEFNGSLSKDQKIEDILSDIKSFGILKGYEINGKKLTLK